MRFLSENYLEENYRSLTSSDTAIIFKSAQTVRSGASGWRTSAGIPLYVCQFFEIAVSNMEDKHIGKHYGCYKIISIASERAKDGHLKYVGKCVYCGETMTSVISTFIVRKSNKCTHYSKISGRKIYNSENNIKDFRIKGIYDNMINRCYDKNEKSYRFYGGKGIKVCDEWFQIPKSFEEWALKNGYKENLTIDRIHSNKSYCPENCRWISLQDNSKWKSTTRIIEINNIKDSGRGWSKRLGLGTNHINIYCRKYGLDKTKEYIKYKMDTLLKN